MERRKTIVVTANVSQGQMQPHIHQNRYRSPTEWITFHIERGRVGNKSTICGTNDSLRYGATAPTNATSMTRAQYSRSRRGFEGCFGSTDIQNATGFIPPAAVFQ